MSTHASCRHFVSFRPTAVVRYLLRDGRVHRWAALAPALYHLALVHAFSRRTVERVEAQILRRL